MDKHQLEFIFISDNKALNLSFITFTQFIKQNPKMLGISMRTNTRYARIIGAHNNSRLSGILCLVNKSHQNAIWNQLGVKHEVHSLRLRSYYSINSSFPAETDVSIQDNKISNSKVGQVQDSKSLNFEKSSYVNYPKIYEQNKRRLKAAQAGTELRNVLFDKNYIQTQLIDTRYFYADIVAIFRHVIEELSVKINSQIQINNQNPAVTTTHLHLILSVYHMYIKQFSAFKQQAYSIIEHFFDHFQSSKKFCIQHHLQLFVYLRKFIDSETALGNGSRIFGLAQKYCVFLEKTHKNKALEFDNELRSELKNNVNFTSKIIKKTKILELYLLSCPNVFLSTFNAKSQNSSQIVTNPILITFEYFTTEFSNIFKQTIDYWLNFESFVQVPNLMPVNFSYRKILLKQFKQEDMNKVFNYLKLVIHRLWQVLDTPKLLNERPQQGIKMFHEKNPCQQELIELKQKYQEGNLNVLNYLPNEKIIQGQEVKFMRLLILMKNLFGYHTLRRISGKNLTNYLERLFGANWEEIISTKDGDKKRQIKILIGQLISRLVSGSWTDGDDVLGKYFETNYIHHNENKGRRNNRGEWFSD